jgi:acyl dehydratase
MYFEDMQIGHAAHLGTASFTRDSILAYARQFDLRVLDRADVGAPLVASGLHVASAAMRRLVETRAALRAAMEARGDALPELGVSPGFRDMRWPHPVLEGDVVSFSTKVVSRRETSKPNWGLVENSLRGINQHGESVLSFSGFVFAARRTPEK